MAPLAMADDLHANPDPALPTFVLVTPWGYESCLRICGTGNALTHSNSSKYIPSRILPQSIPFPRLPSPNIFTRFFCSLPLFTCAQKN